jgi:superfamily II DNA or RNA helicase
MKGAMGKSYDEGIRQQLISAATGTGKTSVFAGIPDYFRSRLPGQTLVLAHREELIKQAIDRMVEVNPHLTVTREQGVHLGNMNADVIVASVDTLQGERALKVNWKSIDKIITDEAHHAINDSYTSIYSLADVLRPDTHKLHAGFTATPQRADGKAMAEVYKKIVYTYSLRRAIKEGYLVEPKGIRVKTTTSLKEVKSSDGDYNVNALADAINTPERNQLVVKAWMAHAQNRCTIGFTANIAHAVALAEMFQNYGINAEAVWGEDPQRAAKIGRHKLGITTVLLNCGVLTEGYDDPQIGCILLARPTRSGVLYCQMVGRGTRLFKGKDDCIVIDIVDATAKNSLLTLPSLMGLSSTLDLKGKGLVWAVEQMEEAQAEYGHLDFSTLADIDSIELLIQNTNLFEIVLPAEVEANSDFTWFSNPTGGYVLTLPKPKDSHFSVKPDKITVTQNLLDKWEVFGAIKGRTYKGTRETVEEAFAVADKLLEDKCASDLTLIRQKAAWHDGPATDKQMKALKMYANKLGRVVPGITKGAASKLIGQFKAGKK